MEPPTRGYMNRQSACVRHCPSSTQRDMSTVGVVATLFRWSWRPRICGFRVSRHSRQPSWHCAMVGAQQQTFIISVTLLNMTLAARRRRMPFFFRSTSPATLAIGPGTLRDELCGMQDDIHIRMALRCESTVYTYVSIRCTLSLISARLTLVLWICPVIL